MEMQEINSLLEEVVALVGWGQQYKLQKGPH
jgi:hypothetical protein